MNISISAGIPITLLQVVSFKQLPAVFLVHTQRRELNVAYVYASSKMLRSLLANRFHNLPTCHVVCINVIKLLHGSSRRIWNRALI